MKRIINWIIQRFYPDHVFYGDKFGEMFADLDPSPPNANALPVAAYLIRRMAINGHDFNRVTVNGFTINNQNMGDWRITIERIAAPEQGQ